ncbi:MAG: hypothetical protein R2932_59585 [Caldilineaceae bacterium]
MTTPEQHRQHERRLAAHLARQAKRRCSLAIANYLIQNDLYNKEYVRRWVNWEETLEAVAGGKLQVAGGFTVLDTHMTLLNMTTSSKPPTPNSPSSAAAEESQVPSSVSARPPNMSRTAKASLLPTPVAQRQYIGNLGGWQVARTLFFLNVLTGAVGNKGGTSANDWNKFTPSPSPRRLPAARRTSCTCRSNGPLP